MCESGEVIIVQFLRSPPEAKMQGFTQTVYLVRHGERADFVDLSWKAGAEAGGIDSQLSVRGMMQARDLGLHLPFQKMGMVISSPFLQAVQTAQCALEAAEVDLPIAIEPGLGECLSPDLCAQSGLTAFREFAPPEILKGAMGVKVDESHSPLAEPSFPETFPQMAVRVKKCVRDLLRVYAGRGSLVLVSHASVIETVLKSLGGGSCLSGVGCGSVSEFRVISSSDITRVDFVRICDCAHIRENNAEDNKILDRYKSPVTPPFMGPFVGCCAPRLDRFEMTLDHYGDLINTNVEEQIEKVDEGKTLGTALLSVYDQIARKVAFVPKKKICRPIPLSRRLYVHSLSPRCCGSGEVWGKNFQNSENSVLDLNEKNVPFSTAAWLAYLQGMTPDRVTLEKAKAKFGEKVNANEFEQIFTMLKKTEKKEEENEIVAFFAQFDQFKSGCISKTSLLNLMSLWGNKDDLSTPQIEHILETLNCNSDKIDYRTLARKLIANQVYIHSKAGKPVYPDDVNLEDVLELGAQEETYVLADDGSLGKLWTAADKVEEEAMIEQMPGSDVPESPLREQISFQLKKQLSNLQTTQNNDHTNTENKHKNDQTNTQLNQNEQKNTEGKNTEKNTEGKNTEKNTEKNTQKNTDVVEEKSWRNGENHWEKEGGELKKEILRMIEENKQVKITDLSEKEESEVLKNLSRKDLYDFAYINNIEKISDELEINDLVKFITNRQKAFQRERKPNNKEDEIYILQVPNLAENFNLTNPIGQDDLTFHYVYEEPLQNPEFIKAKTEQKTNIVQKQTIKYNQLSILLHKIQLRQTIFQIFLSLDPAAKKLPTLQLKNFYKMIGVEGKDQEFTKLNEKKKSISYRSALAYALATSAAPTTSPVATFLTQRDPRGTGYVSVNDFEKLLQTIGAPKSVIEPLTNKLTQKGKTEICYCAILNELSGTESSKDRKSHISSVDSKQLEVAA